MNKNNKGFTLIEVMIVVAIIGILAAIAVPSYSKYVRDANRTDALTELMTYASDLERTKVLASDYGAAALDDYGTPTEHFKFQYIGSKTTFTLYATATSTGQLKDTDCKYITINHLGQKKSYSVLTTPTVNSTTGVVTIGGTETTTCW